MASFTDRLLTFNPYIETNPADDYIKVGMYKQEQYNQGVKTVQQYIDNVEGIDVVKGAQKDYLNQALGSFQNSVGKTVSEDFSNNQLVSQIGAIAGRIQKDPIIAGAIQSTASYRKGLADMETARKEGKLTPQNEYDFQERAGKWLNDGDVTTSFNERYTPYVDVMGEFYKAYKELHPDSNITQDAFRMKDGKVEINPAMQQNKVNGITPDKVAGVASMLFSRPEIANQLRIEGKYTYRGATPEAMFGSLQATNQENVANVNKQISALEVQLSTDKNADKSQITRNIEQLKNQGTKLIEEYKSYASLLNENPEAFKTQMYSHQFRSNLIRNYSWADTAETLEKSPVFDAEMTTLNYELEKAKFAYQKEHDIDVLNSQLKIASLKAKKKVDENGDPIEDNTFTVAGNVDEAQGKKGASTYRDIKANKSNELNQAIYQGVFEIANNGMPNTMNPVKKNPDGTFSLNVDRSGVTGYKSIQEANTAHGQIYTEARRKIMGGKATEEVQTAFSRIDPLIRTVRNLDVNEATINARFAPQIEQIKGVVGDLNTIVGNAGGKQVITNDLVDLWLANSGTPEATAASKRLTAKNPQLYNEVFGETRDAGGLPINIGGNPTLKAAYDKIADKMKKDPSLVNIINEREAAYKNSQTSYIPLETTISAPVAKEKEALREKYAAIAAARSKGNESSDIEAFQKLLKKEGTDTDEKYTGSNIYGFDRDNGTGEVYLTIGRGGNKTRIKVTEQDLVSVPGAQVNNEFWKKYGDDLSLTGNTSTDVPINGKKGGEATAYIMPRNSKSKYSVKYHVTGNGSTYNLQLYVRDAQGALIAGPITPGLNTGMNGILQAIEELKNDSQLETLPALRK